MQQDAVCVACVWVEDKESVLTASGRIDVGVVSTIKQFV